MDATKAGNNVMMGSNDKLTYCVQETMVDRYLYRLEQRLILTESSD